MKIQQVSEHCYAVLNEKNRFCDANSGLITAGGGLVVDTQSDLPHARQMIALFREVWDGTPQRVVNTHEDADHVWGNQLFEGAEIIGHRSLPERMREVADPTNSQKLLRAMDSFIGRLILRLKHPGVFATARQLREDYDFGGIHVVTPTTLFDERLELDLDGLPVHLIYVGPCHQVGDAIVHVPSEGVVFTGDVVFRECTPMSWTGTYENWFRCLDTIESLEPKVIVPGHGPVCGPEGIADMRDWLKLVRDQSRASFDRGESVAEASGHIDLGRFTTWHAAARVYTNVDRAYREFRRDVETPPADILGVLEAVYKVARARGDRIEF